MQVETDDILGLTDRAKKEQEKDREKPPANADRFVWGFRTLQTYYEPEWDDDPHFEPPDGVEPGDRIVFEEDDTVPRSVAERVWFAFSDRIIAYDADGAKIDALDISGLAAASLLAEDDQ